MYNELAVDVQLWSQLILDGLVNAFTKEPGRALVDRSAAKTVPMLHVKILVETLHLVMKVEATVAVIKQSVPHPPPSMKLEITSSNVRKPTICTISNLKEASSYCHVSIDNLIIGLRKKYKQFYSWLKLILWFEA